METMTSCQRSYQQDIESDQPRDCGQELKGRVAKSLRVHLHAERERCVDELSADNRVCEEMRVQKAHTSVARDEANARADIASFTTQLTSGKPRTFAQTAAKIKPSYSMHLEKCDVRIRSWEVKVIQLEALVAERERLPKSVARLTHACMVDDAEDERDEETFLDACRNHWIVSVEETDRA